MAAYFAKNDKPKNIPKIIKLLMFGFFLIRNNINNEREQKKINTISVDIKNEETLTEGNK